VPHQDPNKISPRKHRPRTSTSKEKSLRIQPQAARRHSSTNTLTTSMKIKMESSMKKRLGGYFYRSPKKMTVKARN
jgi:hypothetical protein